MPRPLWPDSTNWVSDDPGALQVSAGPKVLGDTAGSNGAEGDLSEEA